MTDIAEVPSPHLAHQFEDMGQQLPTSTLGMWTFLGTEVMFFGGLFASFCVYRLASPDAFMFASRHLSVTLGSINTAVLLSSSLTVALAVRRARPASARSRCATCS